jgi:hypothetical protein
MDSTKRLITFDHQTQAGDADEALHGHDTLGCPDCGEESFTVREDFSARSYGTQDVRYSWNDIDGDFEWEDVEDEEIHGTEDHESEGWNSDPECVNCGTSYSEYEAREAWERANEDDDEDEDDEDCETTEWPALADRGVAQADVVGALLLKQVAHYDVFTLDERAGKTVIGVKPKSRHSNYNGDGHELESCTQCNGDMSTQFLRVISLSHKQSRYAESSVELHSVRFEAPIELHIPICYVCNRNGL